MAYFNGLYGIVLLAFSAIAYCFFFKMTRDILNPFGIMIVSWSAICALSAQQLSSLETGWSPEMYILGCAFPVIIAIGARVGNLNNIMKPNKFRSIKFSNIYIVLSRLLFGLCLLSAFIEWKRQGFLFTWGAGDVTSDVKSLVATVRGWHYGTVYLPYCSINAAFELLFRTKIGFINRVFLVFQLIVPIMHSLLVASSRGSLLIIGFGIMFLASRKYKLNIGKLFIFAIAVLALFVKMAEKRIWSTSLVFRVVEGYPLFSSIYSYTALNFENLNKLTKIGPSWTICVRSLYGIVQLIGLDSFLVETPKQITVFFNACPIAYDFYDDLGLLGVIIYTFLLTIILKEIYKKSNVAIEWLVLFAALQKPIWIVFFGNYFLSYRIIFFPFVVSWVLAIANMYEFCASSLLIRMKRSMRNCYYKAQTNNHDEKLLLHLKDNCIVLDSSME